MVDYFEPQFEPHEDGSLVICGATFTPTNDFLFKETVFGSKTLLEIYSDELMKALFRIEFEALPERIRCLRFLNPSLSMGDDLSFSASVSRAPDKNVWECHYSFRESRRNFSWNLNAYRQIFAILAKLRHPEITTINDRLGAKVESFQLRYEESMYSQRIGAVVENHLWIFRQAHQSTIALLEGTADEQVLRFVFSFRPEIRTACKQYLLYFADFLRDLGIEAETGVTDEAGKVLFSVIPDSQEIALDAIKEALEIYLELPSQHLEEVSNQSIAVQKLESKILQLRSDLKLASAELQAKDATIEAKQVALKFQDALLSGLWVPRDGKSLNDTTEAKEDVIPGLLSLGVLEHKGVSVNLGELFRRLKKLFTQDD